MNTKEAGKIFEEIATLLELKGANHFKVRAYANAGRILRGSGESIEELAERLEQEKVKGFGPDLTEHIFVIRDLDTLPFLEELRSEFPDGLLDILKLPGLGAKKVKALHEELSINNIAALKKACESGAVSELKGFAKKTEDNILASISRFETYSKFFRIDFAEHQAEELLDYLKNTKLAVKIEIAGSLRRKKELVKDIDLIAASDSPSSLMDAFVSYPDVLEVSGHGETKSSIILQNGIAVDLRVVESSQYASALLHFTGSKDHNTSLRGLAKKSDLKLNEYGLFEGDTAKDLQSEEAIYEALGLSFIPPELREDRGEVAHAEAVAEGKESFPDLLTVEQIKGILHAHTTYSDGVNTLEELALAVKKKGFEYLGVSDHSKSAAYAGGLSEDAIAKQHDEIDALNERLAPFRIFKGIESDILADGSLDYADSVLETFDFIIASVHSRLTLDEKEMTKRIINAVENPYTTVLGHLSGRLLLRRESYALDIPAVLEAAARCGTAVEINANPKRLELDWRDHARAKALGIKIPICPDAHSIDHIDFIRYGVYVARKGGLTVEDVPTSWSTDTIENFFRKKQP